MLKYLIVLRNSNECCITRESLCKFHLVFLRFETFPLTIIWISPKPVGIHLFFLVNIIWIKCRTIVLIRIGTEFFFRRLTMWIAGFIKKGLTWDQMPFNVDIFSFFWVTLILLFINYCFKKWNSLKKNALNIKKKVEFLFLSFDGYKTKIMTHIL